MTRKQELEELGVKLEALLKEYNTSLSCKLEKAGTTADGKELISNGIYVIDLSK